MHTEGWHNNILLFCCLHALYATHLRIRSGFHLNQHTHTVNITLYVLIGVINLTCWQNLMYTSQFCYVVECTAHFPPIVLYFEAIIKAHRRIHTREEWRWWKLLLCLCVCLFVLYIHVDSTTPCITCTFLMKEKLIIPLHHHRNHLPKMSVHHYNRP